MTVASPSLRSENPTGARAALCAASWASIAAMVAASVSSKPSISTVPTVAIDTRCAAGSTRTALTPGCSRRNRTSAPTQSAFVSVGVSMAAQ